MPKILIDSPPIRRIGWEGSPYTPGDLYNSVSVGSDGVTLIDAEEQYLGEYSIIWLRVWKNDRLTARYNARNIDSIIYNEEPYEPT